MIMIIIIIIITDSEINSDRRAMLNSSSLPSNGVWI